MERIIGTVSRGLRAPIIREGDDLSQIVVDTVMEAVNACLLYTSPVPLKSFFP